MSRQANTRSMQAIAAANWGLKPRLQITRKPIPAPGPNDVLVEVHAASVNPKDWKLNGTLSGLTLPILNRRLPAVFGDDLAGVVIAKGAQVSQFELGDAVYGMDMYPRTGSLAQYAVIAQNRIAAKPEKLSFAQAAAMPLAGLTALQGLRDKGRARAGSKVLIIGASGGVGTFAVQIARALKCEIWAVCSDRNRNLVIELGADHVIDYTREDFHRLNEQFDLIFDVSSFETPRRCRSLLAPAGRFVSTGGHPGAIAGVLRAQALRAASADFVWVSSKTEDLKHLSALIDNGQLRVIIDSRFPLADAQRAYDRSRSGRARGKIVIDVIEE